MPLLRTVVKDCLCGRSAGSSNDLRISNGGFFVACCSRLLFRGLLFRGSAFFKFGHCRYICSWGDFCLRTYPSSQTRNHILEGYPNTHTHAHTHSLEYTPDSFVTVKPDMGGPPVLQEGSQYYELSPSTRELLRTSSGEADACEILHPIRYCVKNWACTLRRGP